MEVASSTEWAPNSTLSFSPTRSVDIEPMMLVKRPALEAYAEEMRPFPHARSYEGVEAIARWRGVSVGLTSAEAFMVLRDIKK